MNENVKQIFEMLKIKPNQVFFLKNDTQHYYILNENLILYYCNNHEERLSRSLSVSIRDLLVGNFEVIPNYPNEINEVIMENIKLRGYKWLAKNENGTTCAFTDRPMKSIEGHTWLGKVHEILNCAVPFLSWEDSEPYYIGE